MTYSFFDGLNVYRNMELTEICDIVGYDKWKCYVTVNKKKDTSYFRYKNLVLIKGEGGSKQDFIDQIPELYKYYAVDKDGIYLIGGFEYIADQLDVKKRYEVRRRLSFDNIIYENWTICKKQNKTTVNFKDNYIIFKSVCDGYDVFTDVTKKEFLEMCDLSVTGVEHNIRKKKNFIKDFVVSYDKYLTKEELLEYTKENAKFYAINGDDFIVGKLSHINKWIAPDILYRSFHDICNRKKSYKFGDWIMYNNKESK